VALFAAPDMRTAIYVSSYIRIIHVLYSSTATYVSSYIRIIHVLYSSTRTGIATAVYTARYTAVYL
jgi:hypothetical protein